MTNQLMPDELHKTEVITLIIEYCIQHGRGLVGKHAEICESRRKEATNTNGSEAVRSRPTHEFDRTSHGQDHSSMNERWSIDRHQRSRERGADTIDSEVDNLQEGDYDDDDGQEFGYEDVYDDWDQNESDGMAIHEMNQNEAVKAQHTSNFRWDETENAQTFDVEVTDVNTSDESEEEAY